MKFTATAVVAIVATILFLPQLNAPVSAQDKFETKGSYCESNRALLDDVARQFMGSGERLFVIARLGAAETNRQLNFRRLYNVRTYWKNTFGDNIQQEKLTFAEGEKVKGPGQVEFYLGSKLLLTASFDRRGDFCVDCCEGLEEIYYGSRNRGPKKRRG